MLFIPLKITTINISIQNKFINIYVVYVLKELHLLSLQQFNDETCVMSK